MEETLKTKLKIIFYFFISISFIYLFFNFYNIKKLEEDLLTFDREPLKEYKLLKSYQENDIYYVNLIEVETNKEYNNVYLSKVCLNINNHSPGKLMKLSILKQYNLKTKEESISFDRLFDYLCTNKDMLLEDKKLAERIEESLKRTY